MLERPFYFITVFWGERFRRYFLEFALASLLAPGNIPALRTRQRSKFLIATYPEDWAVLNETPIFNELKKHIEPVFIKIPPCPPEHHGCKHMGLGHRLACEMAYRDRAYGSIIAPDTIISNGAVELLIQQAKAGKKLVLAPACIRLAEEPFLRELYAMNVLNFESRSETKRPIIASGDKLAEASVKSLHSAARVHEWDAPFLNNPKGAPCVFWRVSGNDGFVIHCLSWAPLLIDYAAFGKHDTSCLEQWTIDGDYVFKNIGDADDIYVVTDSDELVYAGFTPEREQSIDVRNYFRDAPAYEFEKLKSVGIFENYNSGLFDPLKQRLFHNPVFWHGHEMDFRWSTTSRRARQIIENALERTIS